MERKLEDDKEKREKSLDLALRDLERRLLEQARGIVLATPVPASPVSASTTPVTTPATQTSLDPVGPQFEAVRSWLQSHGYAQVGAPPPPPLPFLPVPLLLFSYCCCCSLQSAGDAAQTAAVRQQVCTVWLRHHRRHPRTHRLGYPHRSSSVSPPSILNIKEKTELLADLDAMEIKLPGHRKGLLMAARQAKSERVVRPRPVPPTRASLYVDVTHSPAGILCVNARACTPPA